MAVKCEYHCFKSDELSLYLTILQSNFPFKCMNKHLSSLLAHNFLYDISHYLLYKLQNFINYVFCPTFLIVFSKGAIFNSFFLKILKNMLWFTGSYVTFFVVDFEVVTTRHVYLTEYPPIIQVMTCVANRRRQTKERENCVRGSGAAAGTKHQVERVRYGFITWGVSMHLCSR